jgi:hypothetical protein
MFLHDLIKPKKLDEFIINKKAATDIQKLFSMEFMVNLYIYGPAGSGKYTLFIKMLENILQKPVTIRNKPITLATQWTNAKEVLLPSSDVHFEINISKYSNNKNNLFALIETITDTKEINPELPYKIIIIRNIHLTSTDVVKFIKQKAEQNEEYCRIIALGNTNSYNFKILSGTFFSLRLSSPSMEDIIYTIKKIPTKYLKKRELKKLDLNEIITSSFSNLNIIMIKIEMMLLNNFYKTGTEETSIKISKLLLEKKLVNILEIRELIYNYQTSNQDFIELFKHLLFNLLQKECLSNDQKLEMISNIAKFNQSFSRAFKEVVHLEAAIFKLFYIIHSCKERHNHIIT